MGWAKKKMSKVLKKRSKGAIKMWVNLLEGRRGRKRKKKKIRQTPLMGGRKSPADDAWGKNYALEKRERNTERNGAQGGKGPGRVEGVGTIWCSRDVGIREGC